MTALIGMLVEIKYRVFYRYFGTIHSYPKLRVTRLKDSIQQLLHQSLQTLHAEGVFSEMPDADTIEISRTKDASHGDFASNAAMKFVRLAGMNPRALAEKIIAALPESELVEKTVIAGPGFINFFVNSAATQGIVAQIIEQQAAFGSSKIGTGKSVQVEFVSANPTGPLHVGHGRGAAYGAVVSNLLAALGYEVHREYYVNDAGRQMHILAASVWLRYLELAGETIVFPSNGYQGDYVWDIGATLHREQGDKFRHPAETIFADIIADEPAGGDKELHIDALIERAQRLLGDDFYREVFDLGLNTIVENIRNDLTQFGVTFNEWFSERSLMDSDAVDRCIERLQAANRLYEKDGALWFRSTDFSDEKDRVVRRENGQTTYFASDIAYHLNKLERVDEAIDIWGADHHGYVPRVKAAIEAMGEDPARLGVLLIQFAVLYKGGEKLAMSTRSGEFVTLRELREEVGSDAARFFYVMRRHDQHLDFDLDLATKKSNENPVYYIQYAHARICSVLRQASEQGVSSEQAELSRLVEPQENDLITQLAKYPEQVEKAGLNREPHRIAQYLRELANLFHSYYNAHQFLVDDTALRDARLNLCRATQIVIQNGLKLLDVSAPDEM